MFSSFTKNSPSKSEITSSQDKKAALTMRLLEQKPREAELAKLPDDKQRQMTSIMFGGCMGHKHLNAFKYGVVAMNSAWPPDARPVLLSNKANSVTIALAQNSDSEAVRNAVDASSFGAVKLASLAGALFRNKNHITG